MAQNEAAEHLLKPLFTGPSENLSHRRRKAGA
jgi:hypothetical protein